MRAGSSILFVGSLIIVFFLAYHFGTFRWGIRVGSALKLSPLSLCLRLMSILRVFERDRGPVHSVFLGKVIVSWLLDTMESVSSSGCERVREVL